METSAWVEYKDDIIFDGTPVKLRKKAEVVGRVAEYPELLCVRPVTDVIVDCPPTLVRGEFVVRHVAECTQIDAPKFEVI